MNKIKLYEICDILNGYAFKSINYVDTGIRVIRITNVQNGYIEDKEPQFYPLSYEKEIQKYILKENDILISLTGNVGRVALLDKKYLPAALNQRVACMRLKNDIIYKSFLFHFLNSDFFENKCISNSKGIAQLNLSTEWLKNYEIPLYEFKQQIEIANKFDVLSKLIDNRKSQLIKIEELVKSRFIEMFGDPVINPKYLDKHSLNNYIQFITSGSRGWSQYFVDKESELFITIKNVKNNHIVLDDVQYINVPSNQEAKRTKVKSGDLLISITADLGRTGVIDDHIAQKGAYINQHLALVRLDQDKLNPVYVSYFLDTEYGKRQFKSKNQNGVKSGLNFDAIKSLQILIPSIDQQIQFLEVVKLVDKSKFECAISLNLLE